MDTEGFKIIQSLDECFIQEYVMGMIEDEIANNNILHIPFDN